MSRLNALIFTAAVALAPQIARAADLLPAPPMVEPLRGSILVEQDSGFYLRGDVGVGINEITTSSTFLNSAVTVPGFGYDKTDIGASALIGFGAGYKFNNWLRADVTGEYRSTANYAAVASYNGAAFVPNPCGGTGRCYDIYKGSVSTGLFLANGYVDVGTWYGVTPYFGVGVGLAHLSTGLFTDTSIGNTGGGFSNGGGRTNFAWALMTGLGYNVNRNLKLEIGYRYVNMGQADSGIINCQPSGVNCPQEVQHLKMSSHDLRIGMRWMLADGFGATETVDGSALPSAHYARRTPCGACQGQVVGDGQVVTTQPRHF